MKLLTAGIVAASATATSAIATHAYNRPGRLSGPQRVVMDVGYLPVLGGVLAVAGSALLSIVPRTRPLAKSAALGGGALIAGQTLGAVVVNHYEDRSKVGTKFAVLPKPKMEVARRDAKKTLDQIDANASSVVIWAPGTMRSHIPGAFANPIRAIFPDDTALVKLPTKDYDEVKAASDSAEALRIVLDELAARKNPPKIYLSGESQGSWAASEVMADPHYANLVERCVLWGHPSQAEHQPTNVVGKDQKVFELKDDYDIIPKGITGDQNHIVETMRGVLELRPLAMLEIPALAMNNPYTAWLMIQTGVRRPLPGGYDRDPHNYREFMGLAAQLLKDAPES